MIAYLYFLDVILLVRLIVQWNDGDLNRGVGHKLKQLGIMTLLCLPLFVGRQFIPVILLLMVYAALERLLSGEDIFLNRFLVIIFFLIISSFAVGIFMDDMIFHPGFASLAVKLGEGNIFLRSTHGQGEGRLIYYLFFVLFLTNELNHLIRYIMGLIKIEPKEKENNKNDDRELQRGKIIGVIERVLFFFFVITGHLSSIAFILTAKGITRFKELDDKNFAEYVLIGTLLSSSISIFWATLSQKLLCLVA